ncbi:MAG: ABC transporter substrate-binding protein [bacterium]
MVRRRGYVGVLCFVLILLFLLSSGLSFAQKKRLDLWAFVNTHARWFRSMAEDYKKTHPDFDLNVVEIAYAELHDKLLVALQTGVGVPDLADVEQGRFGGFLKGKIGFVDLKDMLTREGYLDQLVASREALYTYKGKVYGVEHALCPVVLYYRSDLFDRAGIAPSIETWDDFITVGKKLSKGDVKMTALSAGLWPILIRQRGVDWFDAEGNVTADSPKQIETLKWIMDLRDKHGIADDPPVGPAFYGAVKEGKYIALVGADWYAGFLKDNVAELEGKWRAIPLPYWKDDPQKRRTSCYGGTGNMITIYSKYKDEAWDFMKYSMLSVEGNVRRYLMTKLWPPYKPAWKDERLLSPDPYFGGQVLGKLFSELGPYVPEQRQSPYLPEFHATLWGPKYWRDVVDKRKTPEQAVKEISDEIRKMMKE